MTQPMQVDTANEDPTYWEKILAESNLEVVEEPEPIPIDEDQLASINAEAEEERQGSAFDPAVLPPVKASTTDWANEELRQFFDGSESFMTGHSIKRDRRGTHDCPEWALNNESCRRLLLSVFPKLLSDPKQRVAAARWAAVIFLFFRQEMTEGQVSEALKLHIKNVEALVLKIRRAAEGKNAHGGPRKKPGRPKKSVQ